MKNHSSLIAAASLFGLLSLGQPASARDKFDDRALDAASALTAMAHSPDMHAREYLIARATCIAVIPKEKNFAFVFGGKYGRGLVSCRTANGWSLPSYMWVTGGSYGFQWGGKGTDEILLFYGKNAIQQASGDRFQFGGDASIAGFEGRQWDAYLEFATAKGALFSYSRDYGLFVGLSLSATGYMIDRKANERIYSDLTAEVAVPSPYNPQQLLKTDMQGVTFKSTGLEDFKRALLDLPVDPAFAPAPTPAAAPTAVPLGTPAVVPALHGGDTPKE